MGKIREEKEGYGAIDISIKSFEAFSKLTTTHGYYCGIMCCLLALFACDVRRLGCDTRPQHRKRPRQRGAF